MQLELPSNPLDALIDQLGGPSQVWLRSAALITVRDGATRAASLLATAPSHHKPSSPAIRVFQAQSHPPFSPYTHSLSSLPLLPAQVAEMTGRKGRLVRSSEGGAGVVYEARNASGVEAGEVTGIIEG